MKKEYTWERNMRGQLSCRVGNLMQQADMKMFMGLLNHRVGRLRARRRDVVHIMGVELCLALEGLDPDGARTCLYWRDRQGW